MLLLYAFAAIAGPPQPDFPDVQSLAHRCGRGVSSHARIVVMHRDSRLVIYDEALPADQINCLLAWAASWRGRIVNGVSTYASDRGLRGPYELPTKSKR